MKHKKIIGISVMLLAVIVMLSTVRINETISPVTYPEDPLGSPGDPGNGGTPHSFENNPFIFTPGESINHQHVVNNLNGFSWGYST